MSDGCNCHDCGVDVVEIGESYMVTGRTWRQGGLAPDGGRLCVGCLEARLGRRLQLRDFLWAPINIDALLFGSERLRDRLGVMGVMVALHLRGVTLTARFGKIQ
jgi:hypothetical protein